MRIAAISLFSIVLLSDAGTIAGERRYNGIQLPDQWPPQMEQLPERLPQPPSFNRKPNGWNVEGTRPTQR